jgi:hypothetical protein
VDAIPAGQVDGTNTTRSAEGGRTLVINKHRYYGNTYPIPATMDMTERMRIYPITPPTIHRVPMTNAGTAESEQTEVVREFTYH